jgi:hypothetical protein
MKMGLATLTKLANAILPKSIVDAQTFNFILQPQAHSLLNEAQLGNSTESVAIPRYKGSNFLWASPAR